MRLVISLFFSGSHTSNRFPGSRPLFTLKMDDELKEVEKTRH